MIVEENSSAFQKYFREGRTYFSFLLFQHKALLLRERISAYQCYYLGYPQIIAEQISWKGTPQKKNGTTNYSTFFHTRNFKLTLKLTKKLLNIISTLIRFDCLTESRCAGNTWGRTERSTMATWRRQWHNIMNFLLVLLQRLTSLSYICITNIAAERKATDLAFSFFFCFWSPSSKDCLLKFKARVSSSLLPSAWFSTIHFCWKVTNHF